MSAELDVRRRRAIFRANHRGTKEMDWLLGKFSDAKIAAMTDQDLELFERLLALPDPDLQSWILDPSQLGSSELAPLIGALRVFHKLDQPVA
jgi:antitoxin CptB